jgi:hypothetical protein
MKENRRRTIEHAIEAEAGDHVFIVIRRPGNSTVSLDLNVDGGLSIRADGYGIGGIYTNVAPKRHEERCKLPLERYCPMCGEKIKHALSFGHHCKEDIKNEAPTQR